MAGFVTGNVSLKYPQGLFEKGAQKEEVGRLREAGASPAATTKANLHPSPVAAGLAPLTPTNEVGCRGDRGFLTKNGRAEMKNPWTFQPATRVETTA